MGLITMNLLLIGERYSPNLGDGVIFDSVESICKEIYGSNTNIICLDISGGSSYKTEGKNISLKEKIKVKFSYLRKKISEIKRVSSVMRNMQQINLNEIDGAIFVGGQLFSEYFSKPIYYISKTLKKYDIPIVFNSCGLGKNEKKKYVRYLNKAFNYPNVLAISIRDNYNDFIKKYKLDYKNVQIVMDPVVECSNFIKMEKPNNFVFGIGIMDPKLYVKNGIYYPDQYYFDLFESIIKRLDENNIKWEFFCNGRINDYDYAEKICTYLNVSKNKIAKRPTTPIELIKLINRYSGLLSFRLHSHIIAYSYKIPSIGFCWDNKLSHFGSSTNRDKYFLSLDENIIEEFNKLFDDFIKNKIEKYSKYKLSSEFLRENKFGGEQ